MRLKIASLDIVHYMHVLNTHTMPGFQHLAHLQALFYVYIDIRNS